MWDTALVLSVTLVRKFASGAGLFHFESFIFVTRVSLYSIFVFYIFCLNQRISEEGK